MKQLTDEARDAQFEAWWESSGQFCRSGGGAYEKTFAYTAWLAALDTAQPVQVNAMLVEALEQAKRWHQGDKWRDDPDNRGVWEDHMVVLDTALAAAEQAQPDLIQQESLFVCGQMGANVTKVYADQAQPEPDGINDMYLKGYAAGKQAQPEREVTQVLKQAYDAMAPMRGLILFDQAMGEISKTLAALGQNQVEVLDFCDKNCTWSDHHPDCKNGEVQPERAGLTDAEIDAIKSRNHGGTTNGIDIYDADGLIADTLDAAIKQGGQHD